MSENNEDQEGQGNPNDQKSNISHTAESNHGNTSNLKNRGEDWKDLLKPENRLDENLGKVNLIRVGSKVHTGIEPQQDISDMTRLQAEINAVD
ncbi:MAG: hypothetical protein ACKVQB_04310 [Bacteroidia bacterium]